MLRFFRLGALIGGPFLGTSASGLAAEGQEALNLLNQQRAANGIPPIPALNQEYASAWCPTEEGGPSGGEVFRNLSSRLEWSASTSPWDNAPLHQFSLYDPLWGALGDTNVNEQACAGLGSPLSEPSAPTFYAFISAAGTRAVPTSETVEGEGPFAPQELVGVPQGTATGPQPILYALGFGGGNWQEDQVRALAWSLTTSNGVPVPGVGLVDNTTVTRAGRPAYLLVGGGVMVPPPLHPGTTYDGSVTWEGTSGVTATQTFSFTTAPAPANKPSHAVSLRIARATRNERALSLVLRFSRALLGRSATLAVRYARCDRGRACERTSSIHLSTRPLRLPLLKRGPIEIRVSTRAFQIGAYSYRPASSNLVIKR